MSQPPDNIDNNNKILNLLNSLSIEKKQRNKDNVEVKDHKFWNTQPVVQHG